MTFRIRIENKRLSFICFLLILNAEFINTVDIVYPTVIETLKNI